MADHVLRLTFGYANTTFTRDYELKPSESILPDIKDNILAVNQSLTSGTAGGLSSFFVSDAGENFTLITDAQLTSTYETKLDLGGGSSAN